MDGIVLSDRNYGDLIEGGKGRGTGDGMEERNETICSLFSIDIYNNGSLCHNLCRIESAAWLTDISGTDK